ncbi:MAG: ornithine carbamoyltransferase [Acidobacteria bacterium]|nr:ornithine carbamoyltransferase [Acidobacteriota bacterium]
MRHPIPPGGAEPQPPLRWPSPLVGDDLLSLADLTTDEVWFLLDLAGRVKAQPAHYRRALEGKTLALLFEKPSLRTRVTFQLAIEQLGGHALYLSPQEVGLGQREGVKDVARNLSCWVQAIVARVYSHQTVVRLAEHAQVPVINGLSDWEHPCQALGDYFTLLEHRHRLSDTLLAWVGDGNNVCHSLIYGAARTGVHLRSATPPGYEPARAVVAEARTAGASIELTHDPLEGVAGADAVYTDVWVSMGQEEEAETRRRVLRPYQVNASLMARAGGDAFFMHCLPARRGEEVTDEVIDSPHSLVCQQAENRLHIQKALLLALLA